MKSLVELHGGTVEVHSAGIGQGSDFVVRLPILVETSELVPPEPTVSEPTTTTAHRILVVDDNRDSASTLDQLMKFRVLWGFKWLIASPAVRFFEGSLRWPKNKSVILRMPGEAEASSAEVQLTEE